MQNFVAKGGVRVTVDNTAEFAIGFGLTNGVSTNTASRSKVVGSFLRGYARTPQFRIARRRKRHRAAADVVDVPVRKGHVVLFANNPVWRGETIGSYFLVFNTILNFDNLNAGRTLDVR
jgi:hypothetical protein